jgi:hypothetical protein
MSLVINPYLFTPIFETAGYTRLWAVTAQSSGNITGSAETDTGYYAVKWWDDSVDVYDSGDPFSKAAAGSLRVFEVYPSDVSGDPSGDFDGFDISDNSLTQIRSEGVTLASSGGAQTGGYLGYWGWWWGPYFSPIVAENGIISDNLLTAEALDQFYTDLDSGTGNLFVSGNLGIDTDDPTIATAKGYTVIGSVPPSTQLLLNFNGSNGSTTFTDSSPNGLTATANGDAEISTTESKFGGSSGYFDGNGDYLQINTTAADNFGFESWTTECWFYPLSISGEPRLLARQDAGTSFVYQLRIYNSALQLLIRRDDGSGYDEIGGTIAVSANQWQHVAVVRSGNNVSLYVNGTLDQTAVFTGAFNSPLNAPWIVGAFADTTLNPQLYFYGYIDDLRIVKGTALYTANFTPPTSQLGVYP